MTKSEVFSDRKRTAAVCAGLAFVTLAVFWEVQYYDFVTFDDNKYVFDNELVLNGLTTQGAVEVLTKPYFANWHPLTMLSYMFDATFFGTGPRGFHTVNLLLHVLNTVLLFLLLRRMTGALWRSAVVAALFALHPYHVEPVAWISSRKDVLSGPWWIRCIWAYCSYARKTTGRRLVTVCALYLLALTSKPMVVTLPFLLVLLDYWPLNRYGDEGKVKWSRFKVLIIEKIPLFVMTGLMMIITYYASVEGEAVRDFEQVSLLDRFRNAPVAYVLYVLKMFWPSGLSPGGYSTPSGTPWWQVGFSVLALVGVTVAALATRKTQPFFVVGWLWFIGMLVPVIGIVSIGSTLRTDRYTYLPIIGLFVLLAWGVPELLKRAPHHRRIVAGIGAVSIVACSVLSWFQLYHWRDGESLWFRILELDSTHLRVHYNIGLLYAVDGENLEANRYLLRALELDRSDTQTLLVLGIALTELGNLSKAREALEEAIRFKPEYAAAYYHLARVEREAGNPVEAEAHLERALELQPDYPEAISELQALRESNGSQ